MPDVTAGVGYPTVAPAGGDPLAMIGKVLQIQGAQQALQNQQMEFKARAAMGPILQQSIDPQTGELDINKFLVHGAANPDVAWKMPEITLQMIQRQNTQADTVNKTLSANRIKYGAMASALTSVIGQAEEDASKMIDLKNPGQPAKPKITSAQIASMLSGFAGENGLIDSKDIAPIMDTITKLPNDQERFAYAKRFMNSARDIEKVSADIYGAVNAHGTGGGTTFTQENRLAGTQKTIGPGLVNTPTVESMNDLKSKPNAQGQPTPVTRADIAPMRTGSGAIMPGSGTQGGPSGLSPSETKRQDEIVKNEVDLNKSMEGVNRTEFTLQQMEDALKGFKAGSGNAVMSKFSSFFQAAGMPREVFDAAASGSKKDLQRFENYALGLAVEQARQMFGTGQRQLTNLDLTNVLKTKINPDTDPRAIRDIMHTIRMANTQIKEKSAMYQLWKQNHQQTGEPTFRPKGYEGAPLDQFQPWWNKLVSDVMAEPVGKK